MSSQTYHGGCHCGAVRFSVPLDLSDTVSCNCSICEKTGTILSFAKWSDFKLEKGADNLSDYLFNKRIIHHLFCRTCGIRPFSRGAMPDGTLTVAVNVRCLDNVDVSGLKPATFDGKKL